MPRRNSGPDWRCNTTLTQKSTVQKFNTIKLLAIDRDYSDLYIHILRQSGYFNTFSGGWCFPMEILTIYFVHCSEIIHVIQENLTFLHILEFSTCFIQYSFNIGHYLMSSVFQRAGYQITCVWITGNLPANP